MSGPRFDPTLLYGRSDFGEAETRLRRLLSLDGLVPIDLAQQVVPVLLVGDGLLPGMGGTRNRKFACSNLVGGAGTGFWIKANQEAGVIIDSLEFIIGGAAAFQIRYLGRNDADPVAIATATGNMIDRAVTAQETSPVVRSGADASAFAAANLIYTTGAITLPAGRHVFNAGLFPFYLAEGCKIAFATGAVTNFNVAGRSF